MKPRGREFFFAHSLLRYPQEAGMLLAKSSSWKYWQAFRVGAWDTINGVFNTIPPGCSRRNRDSQQSCRRRKSRPFKVGHEALSLCCLISEPNSYYQNHLWKQNFMNFLKVPCTYMQLWTTCHFNSVNICVVKDMFSHEYLCVHLMQLTFIYNLHYR